GGVIVESAVTIYRPVQEVYSYWRQFENLPRFMYHLEDVLDLGGNRSQWTAKGPLGTTVSWQAEIIMDVPPEMISWRTLPDSDVVSAGSVWFKPAGGDHGTEVKVKLQYDPPAGKVGANVAWLLGEDAQQEIDEDLRRFKQLLETGEISCVRRGRSGRVRAACGGAIGGSVRVPARAAAAISARTSCFRRAEIAAAAGDGKRHDHPIAHPQGAHVRTDFHHFSHELGS